MSTPSPSTAAFFAMGSTHTVCQDYALAFERGAALSDGCSSSPHTDVGARLLCHGARKLDGSLCGDTLTVLVGVSDTCRRVFGLPQECLDATLLVARASETGVVAEIIGDGIVVGRRRSGGVDIFRASFPSGAPRYASYDLDPRRRARYLQEFGDVERGHVWRFTAESTESDPTVLDHRLVDQQVVPDRVSFPAATYDLVLLLSDGAESFERATEEGGKEPFPLASVVEHMLRIKTFSGVFVERRARAFLRWCAAEGITHYDDFSCAGIYLGNPPGGAS